MMHENPFTPSFGEIPVHLAGRRQIVDSVVRALQSVRRRPELTSLVSGARGTGKTTLLSLLAHKANECGWVAAETTARPGMLEDVEINIRRRASHLIGERPAPGISGVEVAGVGGVSFKDRDAEPANWRSRIEDLLDELEAVGSGLPHSVSAILADKTVSFLRRAQTFKLGRIPNYDERGACCRTRTSPASSARVGRRYGATNSMSSGSDAFQEEGLRQLFRCCSRHLIL